MELHELFFHSISKSSEMYAGTAVSMQMIVPILILSMVTPMWTFRLATPSLFRPSSHSSSRGALFANARISFSNLPLDATEEEIHNLITKNAGNNFKSVLLHSDRKAGRFGTAFIDYDSVEEANSAVEALSTLVVHERPANVAIANLISGYDIPKPRRKSTEHTCFIASLDPATTEEDIRSLCEEHVGQNVVQRISLLRDYDTGHPRGFGYVQFADAASLATALQTMQGVILHNKEIFVDSARNEDEEGGSRAGGRPPSRAAAAAGADTGASVFIGNLGFEVDEEILKDMLSDVVGEGVFQSVRLALDRETGRPRGFAHVLFADLAAAEMAVRELDGLEMMGRLIRVDLSDASGRRKGGVGVGGGREGRRGTDSRNGGGPSYYGA